MDKKLISVINLTTQILTYNIIWLVCILLAAHGQLWQGFFLSTCLLPAQIIMHYCSHKEIKQLLIFSSLLAFLGCIVDSIFFKVGIFSFTTWLQVLDIAPPFLWGIWFSFAIMFYSILPFLFKRYFLLSLLSAFGFPLSYFAGVTLGAAKAGMGINSYLILGAVWALLFPTFLFIYNKVRQHDL